MRTSVSILGEPAVLQPRLNNLLPLTRPKMARPAAAMPFQEEYIGALLAASPASPTSATSLADALESSVSGPLTPAGLSHKPVWALLAVASVVSAKTPKGEVESLACCWPSMDKHRPHLLC